MRTSKMVRFAAVMLVAGIYFATKVPGFGLKEWTILAIFVILGLAAGAWQAMAIVGKKQGRLSYGKMIAYILLSLVVLVVLKIVISGIIPSHLSNSGDSLYVQIFFSIFGLFMARGLVTAVLDNRTVGQLD
jgi:hypothetical protein